MNEEIQKRITELRRLWEFGNAEKELILKELHDILENNPNTPAAYYLEYDIVNNHKKSTHKNNNSTNVKYGRLIILLAVMAFILFFGYFHPTSESITCNKNLTCTVERVYWWNHYSHDTIKLSKNSYMFANLITECSKSHCSYYVNPVFVDANYKEVRPFRYYYKQVPEYMERIAFDNPDMVIKQEMEDFKDYLKNSEIEFNMYTNEGGSFSLILCIFVLFGFIIYYIGNWIENIIKN